MGDSRYSLLIAFSSRVDLVIRCMNRLAKVCARYLGGHRGFSIGIEDVTPSSEVKTTASCTWLLLYHRFSARLRAVASADEPVAYPHGACFTLTIRCGT